MRLMRLPNALSAFPSRWMTRASMGNMQTRAMSVMMRLRRFMEDVFWSLSPYMMRILEWGPLHKLGRICFPVFLFHRIYLASFAALAYSYGFARNSDKGEGSLAAFAVSFSLTLISSLIYAILLEPQINKLTEKILSRVFIKKKAV